MAPRLNEVEVARVEELVLPALRVEVLVLLLLVFLP